MTKTKCGDCNGEGGFSYHSERYGDYDEQCETCGGTGEYVLTPEEEADLAEAEAEQQAERNREQQTERAFYHAGYGDIPF